MTATKHIIQIIRDKQKQGLTLSNKEIIEIVEATTSLAKSNETFKIFKQVLEQVTQNHQTFKTLLTKRELEILKLIGVLNTSEAISNSLNIRLSTVETHRKNIRRKLEIKGNNELYNYAMAANIINTF